uniref:Uncharacterized protein n=1 Tax=Rhizophora mucronata TaxID=61149 RepID=A0A2P2QJL9_RHIMU
MSLRSLKILFLFSNYSQLLSILLCLKAF